MNRALNIITGLVVLAIAFTLFSWVSKWHVVVSIIVAGIASVVTGLAVLQLRRVGVLRGDDLNESHPLRAILLGLVYGLGATLCFGGSFYVAKKLPLGNFHPADVTDRDAPVYRQLFGELEGGAFNEATAHAALSRLERPASLSWKKELARAGVKNLIAVGKRRRPDNATRWFRQAKELGLEHGVNTDYAAELLRQATERGAKDQELRQLFEEEKWSEFIDRTSALMQVLDERQWNPTFPQLLHDACLRHGQELSDPSAQQEQYSRALNLANRYGLGTHEAQKHLSLTRRRQHLHPVAIPPGMLANVVEVTRVWPHLILDVAVEGPPKAPIELTAKDFIVHGSTPRPPVAIVRCKSCPLTNVLLLRDCSPSMAATPFPGLMKELTELAMEQLQHDKCLVKLVDFADRVVTVSDWTAPLGNLTAELAIVPKANTALSESLRQALEELAGRDGKRICVIFGDGENNIDSSYTDEDLCLLANQHGVTIHAVAFRTKNHHPESLETVVRKTAGSYIEATDREHFARVLTSEIRAQAVYRVLINSESIDDGIPVEITIGSGPRALTLSTDHLMLEKLADKRE